MKNNKCNLLNSNILFYLCGFLIPVIGMLMVLFSRHFYPFGENLLFTMDMQTQYVEFFSSLRYLGSSDNSIFCSFSRSWGGNYIGLFAYYLANPLSFLITLFPVEKIYVGILLLTLLKIGLCGLTFSIFSLSLYKSYFPGGGKGQYLLLPLSVCYALMSYNIAYSQALMWLDGVIFLPLVILGVEKLLTTKKITWFTFSLAGCFICNYYTGYMVALFATLYVLFRIFSENKKADVFLRFAGGGLLAAGLSAPLLLPVFLDLFSGKLTGVSVSATGIVGFNLLDFIRKFTNGSYDSLTYSNLPFVYCSYLVLLLAITFYFCRSITKREKIGATFMLVILFLSMWINKLNILWHGFKVPNSYPFRNSFVVSFFLIYMAGRAFIALLQSDFMAKRNQLLLPAFLAIMLIVSVDMGQNARMLLFHIEDEKDYDTLTDFHNYLVTTNPLVTAMKDSDTSLYRTGQLYEYSKNDAMLWGYNGLSHYSSTYNESVNDMTSQLGMSADWLWNSGLGATPLTDALLGVKYVLARYELPDNYAKTTESGYGTALYTNHFWLPLIYAAPINTMQPDLQGDSFTNQNHLLQAISGEETDYFTLLDYATDIREDRWIYQLQSPSSDPLYMHIPSDEYTYTEVFANGKFVGNYFSSETTCNLYLGSFTPEEEITVTVIPSNMKIQTGEPVFASLSLDALGATRQSLLAQGMLIDTHKNGKITGTIHVKDSETIVTSLPYDKGWTVKIDNKKVPASCFADTFLVIATTPGEHTISLSYVSPGFYTGLLIFGIAFLIILRRTS